MGRWGEALAAHRYQSLGYEVLDRNWRCPAGELDLVVARPGPGQPVVFVEVKTRSGLGFGAPVEAVTPAKVLRWRRAARAWLAAARAAGRGPESGRAWPDVRFDVVGVLRRVDGSADVEVVENAC